MNRTASLSALLAGVLAALAPGAAHADPITYTIVNDVPDQSGYTLTGTITTDGTLGALSAANVTGWSFTVTNGTNTYTQSISDPGSSTGVYGVTATATEIDVNHQAGAFSPPGTLQLYDYDSFSGLSWENDPGPYPSNYEYDNSFNPIWLDSPPSGYTGSIWTVAIAPSAAVPEPSSLAMCGIAGLVGLVAKRVRRKRVG